MASIEGLLHEVGRVRIQDRLELKAAEDLYYGGKQLYTNILPQSHHGGGGGGGGQHAEGSGGHGGQHHGGHGRRSQQTSESDPHTPGGGHRGGHHRGHGNRGGDHHATSPGHDKSTTNPVIQAIAETREKVNKALKNEPTAAAGGVQPCAGKGQHHGISVKWYTMVIGGRHHRNSNRRSESNETHTTEELLQQMAALKKENEGFRAELKEIREIVERLSKTHLHSGGDKSHPVSAPVGIEKKQPATPAPATKKTDDDGDDDFELFGSDDDEESAEKKKLTEQRLADYAAKKSKKPGPIAKSSVILDVKPWDDETDMEELEKQVRAIQRDGLVWGGGKMIPLAYGIRKLQIICVIEDDKVSVDDLIETIQEDIADHVQSVDIHAFNKI